MNHILSNQDQRFLSILVYLYNKSEPVTLSNIADFTNSSRRTLQEDFTAINSFISPMEIKTSSEGCLLFYPSNIAEDYIYRCILTNSREFQLIELVFFETHQSLTEYADDLFISLSSLKRMIQRVNQQLSKNGFKIESTPLKLIGDEGEIIRTIINLFYEKYKLSPQPFSKFQKKVLDDIFKRALKKNTTFYNLPDLEKLKYYVLVRTTRLKHNHGYSDADVELPDINFEFMNNFIIKHSFKSVFGIELNQTTLNLLALPFRKTNFALDYQDLQKIISTNSTAREEFDSIHYFVSSISNYLEITVSNEEELYFALFNSTRLNTGEDFLIYNKKDIFIKTIQEDMSYIFDQLQPLYKDTLKFSDFEINQFLYILITHWPGLYLAIENKKPKQQVGVFMDLDDEHTLFIATKLNDRFKNEIIFEPIYINTLSELGGKMEQKDFMVTNVSGFIIDKVPVIAIGIYPSFEDFNRIEQLSRSLKNK